MNNTDPFNLNKILEPITKEEIESFLDPSSKEFEYSELMECGDEENDTP